MTDLPGPMIEGLHQMLELGQSRTWCAPLWGPYRTREGVGLAKVNYVDSTMGVISRSAYTTHRFVPLFVS